MAMAGTAADPWVMPALAVIQGWAVLNPEEVLGGPLTERPVASVRVELAEMVIALAVEVAAVCMAVEVAEVAFLAQAAAEGPATRLGLLRAILRDTRLGTG